MPPVQSAVAGFVTEAIVPTLPVVTAPPHCPEELPATVNGPEPVLFSTTPFVAPLAEMLTKARPLAPIVVFGWFSQKQLVRGLTFGAVK